jgi:hypothetical protein
LASPSASPFLKLLHEKLVDQLTFSFQEPNFCNTKKWIQARIFLPKKPKPNLYIFSFLTQRKKNSIQAKSKYIKPPKTSKTSPSSNKRSKDEKRGEKMRPPAPQNPKQMIRAVATSMKI